MFLPEKMRLLRVAGVLLILLGTAAYSRASAYYLDATRGDDANPGNSPEKPWKSLEKANAFHFLPGDRLLLRAGCRWSGGLALKDSGADGKPIRIDHYGDGAMPRIDGEGKVESTLALVNVEEIEVHHLELTNHGDEPHARRAVLIATADGGVMHHIVVADLYIHDVNGGEERKETGGILFRTMGNRVPSRFDGLAIERNIVWKVDRSGISGQSNQLSRSKWFPSLHVVIRDNYVNDVGGDGIVPWATKSVLVEHNIVFHANQRAKSYNAGIWPWSAEDSLFVWNEAAWTHSTLDGEGFDSDYNSKGTRFFYNLSHDNDGGFMLICTPVQRDPEQNIGNTGTVIAHNISHNDHARIFNLSGAEDTRIEDNAIFTAGGEDVQILLVSEWKGWSKNALFRGNLFDVAGEAHYGHQVTRREDGTYGIAAGWGPASGIRFEGNRYYGRQMDRPEDTKAADTKNGAKAVVDAPYRVPKLDWKEPVFDPARPDGFAGYLKNHRRWMMRLFKDQFGETPQLPKDAEGAAF